MKNEGNKWDWNRRLKSFAYAFQGLFYMLKTQHNAWIHGLAAATVLFFSFYFRISQAEWMFVIIAIGFVFAAESVNTALEKLTDIVSPEKQVKAGHIKDLAAGTVLIAAITALIIGLIIFIPRICASLCTTF